MACTNGWEKRPEAPETDIIATSDLVCAVYGEDTFVCQYVRATGANYIPGSIIPSVSAFCAAGPPPPPTTIDATDFVNPAAIVGKILAIARSQKFPALCQCIPFPPEDMTGQCDALYILGVDYQPGGINPTNPAETEAPGQFLGPVSNFRRQSSPNGQQWEWLVDTVGQADVFLGAVFKTSFPDPQGVLTARRVDGLPDDCGPGEEEPDPAPTPPPEPPNSPPQENVQRPAPGPEGPAGPAGPAGADGAAGPAGPCPTLTGGDVTVDMGEDPIIEFVLSGDCSYDVNIVLPGLSTTEQDLLFGVDYTVTSFPDSASFTLSTNGKYFIPRCGSIVFTNTATSERSESIELHGEQGRIENPNKTKFDSFVLTPYNSAYVFSTVTDTRTTEVIDSVIFNND